MSIALRRRENIPDHTGEVARRLNILADAEVARALLDERVLDSSAFTSSIILPEHECLGNGRVVGTYLGGLLAATLPSGERGRGGFLSLGRLSLRKKTNQYTFVHISKHFACN